MVRVSVRLLDSTRDHEDADLDAEPYYEDALFYLLPGRNRREVEESF